MIVLIACLSCTPDKPEAGPVFFRYLGFNVTCYSVSVPTELASGINSAGLAHALRKLEPQILAKGAPESQ
jgi:hypothetical protein